MKTFYVNNEGRGRVLVPMDCIGDEANKCNTCKARFGCYTGELPIKFSAKDVNCEHCSYNCCLITEVVNCRVFGREPKVSGSKVQQWHLQNTIICSQKPAIWFNDYEKRCFARSK